MANSGNRTVFIGNIPYGKSPAQRVLWFDNEDDADSNTSRS